MKKLIDIITTPFIALIVHIGVSKELGDWDFTNN